MLKSFILILLTSLLATAQTQTPATETSKSGSITGKVVNERGEPLPNAKVSVQAVGSVRSRENTAITDRDGTFRVDGLEPVPYQIDVGMPAYIRQRSETEEPREKQYKIGDSVSFILIKGGVITGTVTNAAGDPVIGVHVSARMIRDSNDRRSGQDFGGRVNTDDRGVYRIYGLAAGT